jgi:hypothetical protein
MNKIKNKPNSVLIFFLISCFAAVAVHADTGKRSLFVGNPILFDGNYLPGTGNLPVTVQSRQMNDKPLPGSGKIALEILAGVAGNVVGIFSGVALGLKLSFSSHEAPGPVWGGIVGSACGSAFGVYLVGNSDNERGSFGSAVLGSTLGVLTALAVTSVAGLGEVGPGIVATLSLAVLPPVGAAILFNSSLRPMSLPKGNALFNLSGGSLGLGVPDINIRPLRFPARDLKTDWRYNVRVLSVEL